MGDLQGVTDNGGGRPRADDPVLRALVRICGPAFARAAGAADTVAGRQARFVAAPGSPEAAASTLRLAAERGLAVVPRGAGTKLDWGAAPAGVDLLLDTGRIAGVRHGVTAGLVAEIGAGTPVRAAQAALAARGQRLATDPPSAGATLGGVLATDEAGPLRHRWGTPCDQVLEVRHLDVDGVAATVPAGAESLRELCGSRKRAAVLLSARLRVQPLPASRLWVGRSVWSPLEVHELVQSVLATGVAPAAVEVDLPAGPAGPVRRGHPAGTGARPGALAVLLEGGPAETGERATRLIGVLGGDAAATPVAPGWWGRYPFTPDQVALRVAVPVADLHAAVYALRDAAGAAVPVRGSAGAGVVHAALPADTSAARLTVLLDAVRGVLLGRGGRCAVLSAPPDIRGEIDLEGG